MEYTTSIKLFDGVTATRVSEAVDVSMRQNKSLQFIRANHSSGSAVLELQVSNDLENWTTYNRLTTNVTNTNAQNDTRVGSVTLNSNTSVFLFTPHGDQFRYIRASMTVVTDGSMTLILSAL